MTDANLSFGLNFETERAAAWTAAEAARQQQECIASRREKPLLAAYLRAHTDPFAPDVAVWRTGLVRYSAPTLGDCGHLGVRLYPLSQGAAFLSSARNFSSALYAQACRTLVAVLPGKDSSRLIEDSLAAEDDDRSEYWRHARENRIVQRARARTMRFGAPGRPGAGKIACFDFQALTVPWIYPQLYGACARALAARLGREDAFWDAAYGKDRRSGLAAEEGDLDRLLYDTGKALFSPVEARDLLQGYRGFTPMPPETALTVAQLLPAADAERMTEKIARAWPALTRYGATTLPWEEARREALANVHHFAPVRELWAASAYGKPSPARSCIRDYLQKAAAEIRHD